MHITAKNGKRYELPKLTVAQQERIEAVNRAKGARERFALMYELLSDAIPAEDLAEIVDGDDLDAVDVSKLASLFRTVEAAYMAPQVEEQTKAIKAQLDRLKPALEALETAQAAANVGR